MLVYQMCCGVCEPRFLRGRLMHKMLFGQLHKNKQKKKCCSVPKQRFFGDWIRGLLGKDHTHDDEVDDDTTTECTSTSTG